MRITLICPALFLFALVGCQTATPPPPVVKQPVVVHVPRAEHFVKTKDNRVLPYVQVGDTLTFPNRAVSPGTKYSITFIGLSPCDQLNYSGTTDSPPNCPVTKDPGGDFITYTFQYDEGAGPDNTKPVQRRTPGGRSPKPPPHTDNGTPCKSCGNVTVGPGM